MCVDEVRFEVVHIEVGVLRCEFCVHSSSLLLNVDVFIKREDVVCEDEVDELVDGFLFRVSCLLQ